MHLTTSRYERIVDCMDEASKVAAIRAETEAVRERIWARAEAWKIRLLLESKQAARG
jgi:hypothetical protein